MTLRKLYKTVGFDIPQGCDGYESLFPTLGVFVHSFVRLEREITWSYVVATNTDENIDVGEMLRRAAVFEGQNKNATSRLSLWFQAMERGNDFRSFSHDLNQMRSEIGNLIQDRNRLVHDTSGSISCSMKNGRWSEPSFGFSQQTKSGMVIQRSYTPSDIWKLVERTYHQSSEIRRITNVMFPNALNIVI